MKASIVLGLCVLILLTHPVSGSTEWDDTVSVNQNFHWNAEKAELRDLDGTESYRYGIGGSNVPGGDIMIEIGYEPGEFDFFNDTVLFDHIIVEGDMDVVVPSVYANDAGPIEYHLLIFPINIDGDPFFPYLFDHHQFLENLTDTTMIETSISGNTATYTGDFNGTHTAKYQWSIKTGLLTEKEVTAESGLTLLVVPGEGSAFGLGNRFNSLPIKPISGMVAIIFLGIVKTKQRKLS